MPVIATAGDRCDMTSIIGRACCNFCTRGSAPLRSLRRSRTFSSRTSLRSAKRPRPAALPSLLSHRRRPVPALRTPPFASSRRTRLKAAVRAAVSPTHGADALHMDLIRSCLLRSAGSGSPVPGVLYSVPAPWAWLGYALQAGGIVLTIAGSRALDVLDLAGVRPVLQRPRRRARRATCRSRRAASMVSSVTRSTSAGSSLVFGAPHMTMTRFVFACVSTAYLAIAIPFEERGLVETFGPTMRHTAARSAGACCRSSEPFGASMRAGCCTLFFAARQHGVTEPRRTHGDNVQLATIGQPCAALRAGAASGTQPQTAVPSGAVCALPSLDNQRRPAAAAQGA